MTVIPTVYMLNMYR